MSHHRHHPRPPVRTYARKLAIHHWHSWRQWKALDTIIRGESHWDPCASYPSRHDCLYTGWASCGIPQRNPCPVEWRGRLFKVRYAQVRWLIRYIAGRYGDPLHALWFHWAHGWY
jgi:hypothetical protein